MDKFGIFGKNLIMFGQKSNLVSPKTFDLLQLCTFAFIFTDNTVSVKFVEKFISTKSFAFCRFQIQIYLFMFRGRPDQPDDT